MPAVRAFAFYAGMALLFNFILQFTCFIAILSLDISRRERNRYDLFCWYVADNFPVSFLKIEGVKITKNRNKLFHALCCFIYYCSVQGKSSEKMKYDKGILYAGFKKVWAPILLKFPVRIAVIVTFFGWLCSSIAVIPYIDVGLNQELSMPEDSYVTTYFKAMFNYLSVGPPVYFVVKDSGFVYSDFKQQDLIRGGDFSASLTSQIFSASKMSNRTFIAKPASSWLDDYMDWAANEHCCKFNTTTKDFCPSSVQSTKK